MTLTRRAVLASAAVAAFGSTGPFRFAVCNETFEGKSFAEGCRLAKSTGYAGIEIAPVTLAADPVTISATQRGEYRRVMSGEGVHYVGLHSLVSAPPGLHLTTPDDSVRQKSWDFFRRLADLAADLGESPVMVLGSGKQRGAVNGSSVADARKRLRDGLAGIAPQADSRKVLVLLEPLSPQFTNVVNTLGEAVALVREIGSPAVQSMFDTHNTVAETEPHDQVIRKFAKYIRHVHVNELDGRHPGTGRYDFALVLRTLKEIRYTGWVSLEVFQFRPSGEAVATEAMAQLRRIEENLGGN